MLMKNSNLTLIFKHCKGSNCPPCNSKHIFMRQPKSTLIPIESCQSNINYNGRLPIDEICSNMSTEKSDYLIGATCPFAIATPTSKFSF